MRTPYHFIWKVHASNEDEEYMVVFELRDYQRNYIRAIPVNKDFITNLIKEMALHEEKGRKYGGIEGAEFMMEGLTK